MMEEPLHRIWRFLFTRKLLHSLDTRWSWRYRLLIEFKNQEKDAKENKRQIQKQRKKTTKKDNKKERQVLLAITQSTELCYGSCCAPNGRCVHQKTGGNEFTREYDGPGHAQARETRAKQTFRKSRPTLGGCCYCSMCGNKRRNSRSAASQLPVGCRPILNTCPLDASLFL
jgi:hypothetical protein